MSQQNLIKTVISSPGFYGKLPSLGDFVSRRLPQEFISPWDNWLQQSISTSKELLGEQWLNSYLTSNIWRFAISPGLSGKQAWVGIVMPSIDRVGRYFPLTIAGQVSANIDLMCLFTDSNVWFEELEAIALHALENDLTVEQFDDKVKSLNNQEVITSSVDLSSETDKTDHAFYLEATEKELSREQISAGFNSLLLQTYLPGYSIWSNGGSEDIKSGVLLVKGMPPLTAYAGMISGQFSHTGWTLHNKLIETEQTIDAQQSSETEQKPQAELIANDHSALDLIVNNADIDDLADIEKTGGSNIISSSPEQRALVENRFSFSRTDSGKVRPLNEDSILDRPDFGLWVVADGMGGHQAGDLASQRIIHKLNELVVSESIESAVSQVENALQQVNQELKQLSQQSYNKQIIGSTVVVLLTNQTHFAYLWAGDSRLYRLRENKLLQLTLDHCSDQEEITDILELGTSVQLKQNNVITRAVGAYDTLELDCKIGELQHGDVFLLSSDGLDKELSFQEIESILIENSYQDSVEILLEHVLSKGARDNVSVITVEVKLSNN